MKTKTGNFNYILIAFILLIISGYGCKKETNDPPIEIKIGAIYQGGVIFYIDETNKHGLISATADQGTSTAWWNGNFIATNASSMTDGSANTTAIIQIQGNSGSFSAKLCRDYRGGGYNDWFLPSKDQLNVLFTQKTIVGGFTIQIYWSSTEYENSPAGSVWVQDFETGQQHLDLKSDEIRIHTRAIRAF